MNLLDSYVVTLFLLSRNPYDRSSDDLLLRDVCLVVTDSPVKCETK